MLEAGLEEELAEADRGAPDADRLQSDRAGLVRHLRGDALGWVRHQRREIEGRILVRSQAIGEALYGDGR